MPKKKDPIQKTKPQKTKPQKTKPPYRSERQSWAVPNTPPAIRPIHRPKPSQNNPKPESSKPQADKPEI